MLSMNVGQLFWVKLFDRPPSKKVGSGLVAAVAAEDDADEEDVEVFDELSVVVVASDSELLELLSDDTVGIGISTVAVTEPAEALFLNSCSAGWSNFQPSSSRNGILVSTKSSSMRWVVGSASGAGVGCGMPSRGASRRFATAVGTGSSSIGDARTMDAREKARPTALMYRVRFPQPVAIEDTYDPAEGPWRPWPASEEVMMNLWPRSSCMTCATSLGATKPPPIFLLSLLSDARWRV